MVSFDATDDLMTIGAGNDIMTLTTALTFYVACNIVSDTASGGGGCRFFERDSGGVDIGFYLANPRQLVFFVDATGSLITSSVTNAFNTGTIGTIIVTWNGGISSAGAHIYVSGVEVTYTAGTDMTVASDISNSTIYLANRPGTPNRGFNGTWYECAIWATVLASSSIALIGTAYHHNQVYNIPEVPKRYFTFDHVTSGVSTGAGAFIDKMGVANATGTMGGNGTGLTMAADQGMYYPASMGGGNFWGAR